MFASPGGVTFAARRFITEKPRIGLSLMRPLAAHSKPSGDFWEFFQKLENTTILDYAEHHDHTLQYKIIIKHVYTWRNSPNLLILSQFEIPSLFCDP